MTTVLLILHAFVTLALIGVVLIQRSEGGGLGIGTSAGMGSFMTGRGTANLLTRTTAVLATLFMLLALASPSSTAAPPGLASPSWKSHQRRRRVRRPPRRRQHRSRARRRFQPIEQELSGKTGISTVVALESPLRMGNYKTIV